MSLYPYILIVSQTCQNPNIFQTCFLPVFSPSLPFVLSLMLLFSIYKVLKYIPLDLPESEGGITNWLNKAALDYLGEFSKGTTDWGTGARKVCCPEYI